MRRLFAAALLVALIVASCVWWRTASQTKSAFAQLPEITTENSPGDTSRDPSVNPPAIQPATQPVAGLPAPVPVSSPAAPSDGEIGAFAAWSRAYLAASETDRPTLVAEGSRLATARRPVFKKLIQEDPRLALEEAVPMVVRQQLPGEILALLENRVNGVGALRVYQGVPPEGAPSPAKTLTFHEVEMRDGPTYRAHIYGRRSEKTTWTPGASLNGVSLDADFAVNENPYRTLEVGEKPDAARPIASVCPVSGKSVLAEEEAQEPVAEATPAIETATETLFFCDGSHLTLYQGTLIMAEGGSGGAFGFTGILPAVPTPSIGVVKVLYLPVTYLDQNGVPSTEAKAYEVLRDVSDFYAKASYGKLTLVSVVTPPIKLPHTEAWYINRDTSNGGDISGTGMEHNHARAEARKMGFDDANYDCVVMRHTGGPGSYGGLGGGSSVWVRGDGVGTLAHEIGHCFGLAHANFWDTAGTSSIGAGTNSEYGDTYDIMGSSGGFPAGHYNAQAKNQIKWLPDNFVERVTQSGLYRIYAFDQTSLDPSNRYAMTIVKDAQRTYWGEVRSRFTSNPWAEKGMILGWRFPSGGGNNIQLIDTTPGSPAGNNSKDDAPISLGTTFSDYESGIHLTAVNVNTSPRYVDVMVNLGQFPTNQAPTLALAASSDFVPVGATVTFTATASDPDGDPLAYGWQHFGDSNYTVVEASAPLITRTFTTAGTYVVTCTVSDMKGGAATRSRLITVGNGNSRFTIGGRVTILGQGLPNVTMKANGANGVVTDSDGYFTIPNLTANTYTLSPLLYGYAFGELFNNSITVGPNFTGADFEATADAVVTIVASQATANELAPVTAGKFTITRTGDITQPLTVNVNTVQGSATKDTDYTLTPDYVAGSQGFSTLTIPADAASLDVLVTPVVDTTAEGPESVTLELGPGNGYVVGAQASSTVTIADDDSILPKVSVTTAKTSLAENAASPAVITFSTAAPVGANLTINYTATGTATSGADFVALPGTATIVTGASSTTVNLTPVNDVFSEPMETVRIATSTNAAYLVSPQAANVTVNLVDDDVQVVDVAASDPAATEVDLTVPGAVADTATFVVARSGDITQPLTVYYAVSGTNASGVGALHGVDYEALPGVLLIPAGQASASVTILPRYDGISEGAEIVQFQLGAGPTNYILGASASATATIADAAGDLPVVEIIPLTSATEGGASGTFRMSVRGAGTGTVAVPFSLSGTATVTTDYTVTTNATLTFNPGTLTGIATFTLNNGNAVAKDVTIAPVNDAGTEPVETVVMTVTPNAAYRTFAPTATASMWLRDNDQPTVYVDTQVGTSSGAANSFTEGASTTPVKFYVSRTGSTTNALTVNYTLGGTATNGSDYAALSGTATILAGALGVDVPVSVIDDAIFEGTETVIFQLAPGTYAAGNSATLYLTDNETGAQTVAFTANGSRGPENIGTVNIPVTLASPATTPVSVEYLVDSGTRTAATASFNTLANPQWVRVTRTGNSLVFDYSTDGINWRSRRTALTISMSSTSYLVGLAAGSTVAGSTVAATIDNVSVTGLSAGGSAGALLGADIGTPNPAGSHGVAAGVYTVNGGGTGVSASSTADAFRYVYFPITNSANCTIVARIVSVASSDTAAKAGIMIRESTAVGSRHTFIGTNPAATNFYLYRAATNGNASNASSSTLILPYWTRLVRNGTSFSASRSQDGVAWTALGAPQTMDLPNEVLAGLAVSSRSDGTLSTAVFDNVTFSTPPTEPLQGRTVGFLTAQGSDSVASGVYTVNGSGAGLNTNSQDECHFLAAPVAGNFTLTARVVSQTGGAVNQEAGLMIRENAGFRSRMIHIGAQGTSGLETIARTSSITTAFGAGIDHTLGSGVLDFAIGEQTKNITFDVVDDNLNEPNESVDILLRNPNGARLGTISQHLFVIEDDDLPPAIPFVGFSAAASNISESAGAGEILVSLSAPATAPVSVNYAVTGGTAGTPGDFTLTAGTVQFAIGESVKAVPLSLVDDTTIEGGETIVVELSGASGANPGSIIQHTLTIDDDDRPIVTIIASDPTGTEAGDPAVFTVNRSGPPTGPLVVNFTRTGTATSGTDFTAVGTSVTIPDTQSSATVTVNPSQDTSNEGSETVILTLASDSAYSIGTPNAATVTILDDDRSTVTIAATDPTASETPGNSGVFTISRTAPTTGSLNVNLTLTGTATNGTDYSSISSSITFIAGQTSRTGTIAPIDDAVTEGDEVVTLQIATGSTYDVGSAGFDDVTILDNDSPPTLYISSPTAQGPLVAGSNGVVVAATVTDDGAPSPVTLLWTQVSGPGVATIEAPASAATGVTFSADGTYVLRITATDGQFTVSDQVSINVGSTISANSWLSEDLNPSSARRGQSGEIGGVFTVSGTGAGYGGTADGARVVVRQVNGDGTIVARVTSLAGSGTPLTGVTIRDTMHQSALRAVLGYDPGGVRFRTRTATSSADATTTPVAATLPVWLRLERNATTDAITASFAPDLSGTPGAWTQVGVPTVIAMDDNAELGLTTTSNSTATVATAVLDHVTLSPAPGGAAVLSEDSTVSLPAQPGSASFNAGTYTIAGGSSSTYFHVWEYHGDLVVTVKQTSATSSAGSARSGIVIRESSQAGGNAMMGRIPQSAYNGFTWTSVAGGSSGGVPAFTSAVRWIRMIRRGNTITAFHAPDSGGNPGVWTQVGQPQTVIMTTPVYVGLFANNSTGVGLNTVTFTNLSIVPLNKAPVLTASAPSLYVTTVGSVNGSMSDDNFPTPPNLTTLWNTVAGPGLAVFGNSNLLNTSTAFPADGTYVLRLNASDGSVQTFDDVSLTAHVSPFAQWQLANFAGGSTNPNAGPLADADLDGSVNVLEYATGTNPNQPAGSGIVYDVETIGTNRFLRITITKNPSASEMSFAVQVTGTLTVPESWTSTGTVVETNDANTLLVRDAVPIGENSPRFIRAQVSQP
jgi:regulation of enolase protein 1 (concanavalin A-like superfamily)